MRTHCSRAGRERLRGLGSFLLAVALGTAPRADAGALASDIVRPLEREAARLREAADYVKARAAERAAELEAWASFLETQQEQLSAQNRLLEELYKKNQKRLQDAVATARQLQANPDGKVLLPHFGWTSPEDLTKSLEGLKKEYDEIRKEIGDGNFSFHVLAIGWVSQKELGARIRQHREEVAAIHQAVADGIYGHGVPGYDGKQTINGLRQAWENLEKTRADILNTISRGEYAVNVPFLGTVTRNGVNTRLAQLAEQMAELRRIHGRQEFKVGRGLWLGAIDARGLADALKAQQQEVDRLKKHVQDDIFSAHFPKSGWLCGKDIRQKILDCQKAAETTEKSVAEGTFSVNIPGVGVLNQKQIESATRDLQQRLSDLSGRQMDAEARKKAIDEINKQLQALAKGAGDIAKASSLDVAIWAMEKSEWTAWLGPYVSLIKPVFESKKLTMEQFAAHQGDFALDLETALKPLEDEHAKWTAALNYLP